MNLYCAFKEMEVKKHKRICTKYFIAFENQLMLNLNLF
jgi:hypothetical protein